MRKAGGGSHLLFVVKILHNHTPFNLGQTSLQIAEVTLTLRGG